MIFEIAGPEIGHLRIGRIDFTIGVERVGDQSHVAMHDDLVGLVQIVSVVRAIVWIDEPDPVEVAVGRAIQPCVCELSAVEFRHLRNAIQESSVTGYPQGHQEGRIVIPHGSTTVVEIPTGGSRVDDAPTRLDRGGEPVIPDARLGEPSDPVQTLDRLASEAAPPTPPKSAARPREPTELRRP